MPIYEYTCNKCSAEFEELVMDSSSHVTCPKCSSPDITRKFSLFGMSGVKRPVSSSGSSGCSSCGKSSCSSCG